MGILYMGNVAVTRGQKTYLSTNVDHARFEKFRRAGRNFSQLAIWSIHVPAEQRLARTPTKRTVAEDIDLEPLDHDVVVHHCIGGVSVAHWRPSRGRRPLIRWLPSRGG